MQVPGNENPSILICFASKSFNAGQVTSKMHVIELGAQPGPLLLHWNPFKIYKEYNSAHYTDLTLISG